MNAGVVVRVNAVVVLTLGVAPGIKVGDVHVRPGHPRIRLRYHRERDTKARRPRYRPVPHGRDHCRVPSFSRAALDRIAHGAGGDGRAAERSIQEAVNREEIHLVANRRQVGDEREYLLKEREQREDNYIPPDEPILFLKVDVEDASEFADVLEVKGAEIAGYKILRAKSS